MESQKERRGRKAGSSMLTPTQKIKKYTSGGNLEDYRFNYLIKAIDQKKILENGWNLDIIDMAIFNQIKDFIDSGYSEKITDKLGEWFFVCESKTIRDLPCVPINSKSAVYSRINKLVECGLIERHPTNRLTGKKYIRVTTLGYQKLTYDKFKE